MSKREKTRNSRNPEPSQRQLRVGEQLRHIIAETLQRGHFHDEILMDASRVTVTEVRVSPDLKNATAYVIALGSGDEEMEEIIPALNEAAPVFQKEFNRQANLKFTPRVRFMPDQSFERVQRIDNILRGLDVPDDEG